MNIDSNLPIKNIEYSDNELSIETYDKNGSIAKLILLKQVPIEEAEAIKKKYVTFITKDAGLFKNGSQFYVKIDDITKLFGIAHQDVTEAHETNRLEQLITKNSEKGLILHHKETEQLAQLLVEEGVISGNEVNNQLKDIEGILAVLKKSDLSINGKIVSPDNLKDIFSKLSSDEKKEFYKTLLFIHKKFSFSLRNDIKINSIIPPHANSKGLFVFTTPPSKTRVNILDKQTFEKIYFLYEKEVINLKTFPQSEEEINQYCNLYEELNKQELLKLSLHENPAKRKLILSTLKTVGEKLALNQSGRFSFKDGENYSFTISKDKQVRIYDQESGELVKILMDQGATQAEILGGDTGIKAFASLKGRVKKFDPQSLRDFTKTPESRQKLLNTFTAIAKSLSNAPIKQEEAIVGKTKTSHEFAITPDKHLYIKQDVIGQGSFKKVSDTLSLTKGDPLVLAKIKTEPGDEMSAVHQTWEEVHTIKSLHTLGVKNIVHPYIVSPIRHAGIERSQLFLLQKKLVALNNPELPKNQLGGLEINLGLGIIGDVAIGLHSMHKVRMVHSDFKLANILLDPLPKSPQSPKTPVYRGLISDFGGTGEIDAELIVSTKAYTPPKFDQYDNKLHPSLDCYGLGVTIFEIITRSYTPYAQIPFNKLSDAKIIELLGEWKKIYATETNDTEENKKTVSKLLDICKGLLVSDHDKRLTMDQVLQELDKELIPGIVARANA